MSRTRPYAAADRSAALAAATAVHAGFQVWVTGRAYPRLLSTPAPRWRAAHDRHTRRITPVVGVVYGAVVAAGVRVAVRGASGAEVVSLVASGVALGTTALVAGPAHGRLGRAYDPVAIRRLRRADRVRCAAALLALAAAGAGGRSR